MIRQCSQRNRAGNDLRQFTYAGAGGHRGGTQRDSDSLHDSPKRVGDLVWHMGRCPGRHSVWSSIKFCCTLWWKLSSSAPPNPLWASTTW